MILRLVTTVAITLALCASAAAQQTIAWTDTAQLLGARNGEQVTVVCPVRDGAPLSQIWGTDIYTDDSRICVAAIHAGAITEAGGPVTIEMLPGQPSYQGTQRNGVVSNNYGPWNASYRFVATPAATADLAPAGKPAAPGVQPSGGTPPDGLGGAAAADGPATADTRCLSFLTAGVGLNEGRVLWIIDTYPEIRLALQAIPGIDLRIPSDGIPAFLCEAPTAALDAAVDPHGFPGFEGWASLFATTMLAHMFATADPAATATLAEALGVAPPAAHIAAIAPHVEAFATVLLEDAAVPVGGEPPPIQAAPGTATAVAATPAEATAIGWRDAASYLAAGADIGQLFTYSCPAWTTGAIPPTIRGTDVYTADSYVCGAAVHAGLITAEGGTITIEIMPGQNAYTGSERNGVQSRDFGAFGSSFRFLLPAK